MIVLISTSVWEAPIFAISTPLVPIVQVPILAHVSRDILVLDSSAVMLTSASQMKITVTMMPHAQTLSVHIAVLVILDTSAAVSHAPMLTSVLIPIHAVPTAVAKIPLDLTPAPVTVGFLVTARLAWM